MQIELKEALFLDSTSATSSSFSLNSDKFISCGVDFLFMN